MSEQLKFGTDGVRGESELFTKEYLQQFSDAVVHVLGSILVYLGNDGRQSAERITAAIETSLGEIGVSCIDLGLSPTPAIAQASENSATSIMITASHNQYTDNGLKVFFDGGKITDVHQQKIEQAMKGDPVLLTPMQSSFSLLNKASLNSHYMGNIKESLLDLYPASEGSAFPRIVMDCANGAMSSMALSTLGYVGSIYEVFEKDSKVIHNQPNGTNINDGCGSTDTNSW